jgi:Flp pilus assembly protein TadG
MAYVLLDRRGVSILEFAIAAPVMLALAIGTFKFGATLVHQMALTNAAAQGALTLALGRGTASPYSSTTTAITNAASGLTAASITTTVTINGTTCSNNTACSALMTAGVTAVVRTTYPCDLSVMGINYKSNCTISAQTAQMIQ